MSEGVLRCGFRKSSSGQVPVLAAILFLFLVPTTIILAENATDNVTGGMIADISPDVDGRANQSNSTIGNATFHKTNLTIYVTNTSLLNGNFGGAMNHTGVDNSTNAAGDLPDGKATLPAGNEAFAEDDSKDTFPINVTLPNATLPARTGPVLTVDLDLPDRIDRNEPAVLTALISNSGDSEARGVEIEWILPGGMDMLEGSGSQECDIPAGAACESEITVAASLSSELGEREVNILVRYHD